MDSNTNNFCEVNIRLKEALTMSHSPSFHPVYLTNGTLGIKVDLLRLLVDSPLLQDIVLSLGVPISWLEDLNVIVPEISFSSIAMFKILMEEPSKVNVHDETYKDVLITMGILRNPSSSTRQSSTYDSDNDANDVDESVIECDWVPKFVEVDSIDFDSDSSSSNNNDGATDVNREEDEDEDKEDYTWTPTPNHRRIVVKKKERSGKKRFQPCGNCVNCRHNASFKRCGKCSPCFNPKLHRPCVKKLACLLKRK